MFLLFRATVHPQVTEKNKSKILEACLFYRSLAILSILSWLELKHSQVVGQQRQALGRIALLLVLTQTEFTLKVVPSARRTRDPTSNIVHRFHVEDEVLLLLERSKTKRTDKDLKHPK